MYLDSSIEPILEPTPLYYTDYYEIEVFGTFLDCF